MGLEGRLEEIRTSATIPRGQLPYGKDWVVAPPDFVGIGAQRAGTSRWYKLVTDHPAIHRHGVKERHFFDRGMGLETVDAGAYHRYFMRPPGLLAGEWTPRYMFDLWTPPLLAKAAPDTNLLAILRDPVERLRSGLAYQLHMRDLGTFINLNAYATQQMRSSYLPQLRNVLRYFRRDRLLVLQFERCVDDPAGELRRTYEFLGVDPDHRPASLGEKVLAAPVEIELPTVERERLVGWFEEEVRRLAEEFPEIDLDLWPNFRGR
jgi:hypothetical protein